MAFPRLNSNEFYNGLYNAYRLVTTLADQLEGLDDSSVSEFKTDGGMYGDTLIYTDMDVLMSRVFDPEDTNTLAPEMVVAPEQQNQVIDKMRQIGLYTDNVLSKRAWMDASSFDQFESVVQKQVSDTKRIYEQRLVDCFLGTERSQVGKQTQDVDIQFTDVTDLGEKNRLTSQAIAKAIADIFVNVKDSTRDYNDNGFMKAFKESKLRIVWNAEYYNQIRYTDLPTIYHKDELLKEGKVLPASYFNPVKVFSPGATADGTTHRAYMQEYKIRVDDKGEYSATGTKIKNVFPGELLPKGTPICQNSTTAETTGSGDFVINGRKQTVTYYSTVHACSPQNNRPTICIIYHENGIKFPSSFETSTEFWNPKNLRTNRYLTWIYANPFRLKGYPFILVRGITG